MASKDFQDLMDLLFKKKLRIQKITVSPYSDGAGHSDISFVGSTDTFSSTEPDVVNYALHIHQTIDSDGNYELVAFKDLDQYFRETDFLFKDEQPKLNRAARDLAEGRYTLDFDPDELIEEFLLSSNRESNRFSKLKSEHSYIAAYCANAAAYALKQYEQVKAKTPGIESYHQAMDKVYMRAFRSDPNFVKNYIRRKTSNDFNLLNYMIQVKAITQHVELLKIIFARGGIHVDQGIHLLLESYRKSAEACVKPLNLLRIGLEIANGDPCPKRTKGAEANKSILQSALGAMLDCYDPRIRNSESHLSTEIDAKNGQVFFFDDTNGRHEFLVKYSYFELADMANSIQNYLFPRPRLYCLPGVAHDASSYYT